MQRRDFLLSAAAVTGVMGTGPAWARPQTPDARKLARISMMTLNFTTLLKTPHQPPGPDRTLELFDLPQMYADTYGVHNIELMHYHMAASDPAYFRALRERIDRAKSKTTQLVVEFGGLNISAPDHNFLPRLQALDLTKVWIDRAVVLGCPRIMVNQGQPSSENRTYAVETLKAMGEYGASKGVKVTMETRGNGGAARGATPPVGNSAAPVAAASAPAGPPPEPGWVLLNEIAKSAGTYINIDIGGIGATSQDELHAGLRGLLPTSSGSIHVKNSAVWDLATALRFIEAQGYTGIYSIEAPGHERTRAIYDVILATI